MTPTEFRAQLKALGLTAGRFATLTGVRPETVSRWGNTLPDAPAWVALLLNAWSGGGIPGATPPPAPSVTAKPPKTPKPKINPAAIMAAADRVTVAGVAALAAFDALAPLRQSSAPACPKCGFLIRAGRCTNRGCKE